MAEKNGIAVPGELLAEAKAKLEDRIHDRQAGQPEMEPGVEAKKVEALQSISKVMNWVLETGDSMAKKKGYPGLGEVPPGDLSDLMVVVAEENLPQVVLEKSPEFALVSILGFIGYQNYLAHQEMVRQAVKKEGQNQDD